MPRSIFMVNPMLRRTLSVALRAALVISAATPSRTSTSATLTTDVMREPSMLMCCDLFFAIYSRRGC